MLSDNFKTCSNASRPRSETLVRGRLAFSRKPLVVYSIQTYSHQDGDASLSRTQKQHSSDQVSVQSSSDRDLSMRLKEMSSTLIEQMQQEAGERLALQQQLLKAQREVLDAYSKEEASIEERAALQSRADRLSATISMMEDRSSRLQADLEALQLSRQALSASRDMLTAERNALAEKLAEQQQALTHTMSVSTLRVEALQREVDSTKGELARMQQQLEQAWEQQGRLNADIQSLQTAAAAATQERDASLQELSSMRARLAESQQGQAQLQDAMRGSQELQQQHKRDAAAALQQLATVQAALERASELLQNAVQERDSLSLRNSEASEQVRSLSQEIQALLEGRRSNESEIGAVRQQLTDLQAQQEGARQQLLQDAAQQLEAVHMEGHRDVQRLQMMLDASERDRELETKVMASNYKNLMTQNAALSSSMEQLMGKLREAETELQEARVLNALYASEGSPAVQAARQAAAAATERTAAAEAAAEAAAQAAAARVQAAEAALQEQAAATARESARASAAEEALAKQVAAAQGALQRSMAAEAALKELREAATQRAEQMEQELQEARHRLTITEAWLQKRMAVIASLPRRARGGRKNKRAGKKEEGVAGAPSAGVSGAEDETEGLPGVGHSNMNRYCLQQGTLFDFVKALAKREASLQSVPGYLGMHLQQSGSQDFKVQTLWESQDAFEAWSLDRNSQQQAGEMPQGVFQYMPNKGEGIPDGFTPFKSDA